MSKTNTTKVLNHPEIDVKPVPTGKISINDFINSAAGKLCYLQYKRQNLDDIEKFYG